MKRHFPAKMPKPYNSNIFESINRIKSKFEPEAETSNTKIQN